VKGREGLFVSALIRVFVALTHQMVHLHHALKQCTAHHICARELTRSYKYICIKIYAQEAVWQMTIICSTNYLTAPITKITTPPHPACMVLTHIAYTTTFLVHNGITSHRHLLKARWRRRELCVDEAFVTHTIRLCEHLRQSCWHRGVVVRSTALCREAC
jgi:hypothetical protein